MATNLISVVMQFLTPDMIAKIASALGLDRNVAQKVIGAAVPTLLAGLADVASTPNGARQLSTMVAQQPAPLDGLKSLISGADPKELMDSGSNMLSGLFGGSASNALAQSIASFAGLNQGAGKSILGMLAPVVLGALGQQQRTGGLDAGGLASLLTAQKSQFTTAIPSGLASQLSAAGLIDSADAGVRAGAAAASAAAGRVSAASQRTFAEASRTATTGVNVSQWPYWLAAVAVVAGLAWYFLGRPGEQTVAEAPRPAATTPATGTVGMAPNLTVGAVNLGSQVNASVDSLRSVLPSITDAASAEAALPKIRDVTAQLSEVSSRAAQLTPEGKAALAKLIAAATPAINQLCDKVLATPGVRDVAKPTIDQLRGQLDTLSRA